MKFLIDWTIEGTREIEAESREEAQRKFDRLTPADLSDDGEFNSGDPVTEAEADQAQSEWQQMLNGIVRKTA